ncbi:hypothetical protein CQW23_02659 [Capsicum baccatum]|uniref:Pollen-specific LRR extensin-like protein n=1 Tax=Capsicum baccatum TaxID=33114 RepID=A0A2G2XS19_CAPBA|nr:hypothetical protein CQW23_02659 [Capsicum baccatum]
MGSERGSSPSSGPAIGASTSSSATSSPSGSGKRNREPEDEVYLDNLHSHKRYLSEIMASSLNGLTVGDALPDNIVDSPSRSETMLYIRDEMSFQYSPMSEDSDDSRCYEPLTNTSSPQPESRPTSPVSPYRYHRPVNGFSSGPPSTSCPSHSCYLPPATSPQPRQRGSDSEGRFPSSPSDICHSADLRRAALLRSVQMRTQPPGPSSFELHFTPGQEPSHMETEDRPCSYMKSLVDEREYKVDQCSSMSVSAPETGESACRILNMEPKGDESVD